MIPILITTAAVIICIVAVFKALTYYYLLCGVLDYLIAKHADEVSDEQLARFIHDVIYKKE